MKYRLLKNKITTIFGSTGNFLKKHRWLNISLRIVFIAASMLVVLNSVSVKELSSLLADMRTMYLLPAAFFFIVSKLFSSFRLNMYFRDSGIVLSENLNLKLYAVGMFYNFFLPGGIGGDGYKIFWLRKEKEVHPSSSFKAVLTDRLNGVTALIGLSVVIASLIQAPFNLKLNTIIWSLMVFISMIAATYLFYKTTTIFYIHLLFISFCVQFFQILTAVCILMAFDVNSGYLPYLWLFLVSSVVAMLPISIGGLGSRELAFLTGSKLLLLDVSLSVSLSMIFYLISLVVSFTGIYFIFKKKY